MNETLMKFPDAIPFSKEGFGVLQNTYGSGRLGVVMTHFGGLGKIFYMGPQPEWAPRALFEVDATSSYSRLFRHQILVEGEPYNLEFSETRHYPFGYASHFRLDRLEVLHRLTLLDHALVFSVEVVSNPKNLRLAQRLEHHGYTATIASGPVISTVSEWGEYLNLRERGRISDAPPHAGLEGGQPDKCSLSVSLRFAPASSGAAFMRE